MAMVHGFFGLVTVGFTIWLGLRACIHLKAKEMHWDTHSVSGIAILASSLVPFFTGVVMTYMRKN
jgi:hypothetical protein